MSRVEVLLSTMNKKNKQEVQNLIKQNNIQDPVLVINQMPKAKKEELWDDTKGQIRVKSFGERGLSKSRNHAIQEMKEEIGLIADDDVIYQEDYQQVILNTYQEYPKADIIAFRVEGLRKNKNRKPLQTCPITNYLMAMKIASVQITFQKKLVRENNLLFDPDFGTGSKYNRGEETVWLCDCLRKGLKIQYVDKLIGTVSEEESSWFHGYDAEFLYHQGAYFYRMSKWLYPVILLQYAIRKYGLYQEKVSFLQAIAQMRKGAWDYRISQKTKCREKY